MRKISTVPFALMLAACGQSAPPSDTAQSLLANPERLKEVQRLCKEDPEKMGAACNAASEAVRLRFLGNGQTHYTPEPASKN